MERAQETKTEEDYTKITAVFFIVHFLIFMVITVFASSQLEYN